MGRVVGIAKGSFKIGNLPILQQMVLGVMTENGLELRQSPILVEEREGLLSLLKRSQMNKKISKVLSLSLLLKAIDGKKDKDKSNKLYKKKKETLV